MPANLQLRGSKTWNSHDLDRIVALYSDVVVSSPLVLPCAS